jgi:hypothetical protein
MKVTYSIIKTGAKWLALLLSSALLIAPEVYSAQDRAVSTIDEKESTHLAFMREEEKLAHDVYVTLGERYSEANVFALINESEQTHTDAVKDLLDKYNLSDPSTDSTIGVFTGAEWGWYFTEKYSSLTASGEDSLLSALYVGALIEELDMHDILFCPEVIVETRADVEDQYQCGDVYTDEKAIHKVYQNLLNGSALHLKAFVSSIEKFIGEGNYEAQYLSQEEVDNILGR